MLSFAIFFRILFFFVLSFHFTYFSVAHGLHIAFRVQDHFLIVEVYFDDDLPAQGARVILKSEMGVIAELKTDEKGLCRFTQPPPGKYYLVADAGAGHRVDKELEIKPGTSEPPGETRSSDRWWKVVMGLTVIFLLTLITRYALRIKRTI